MLGPEDPTKRNYAKTPKQIIINYWQSCNKEFNSISQRIPSCDYDSIIQEWIVAVRRTTKKIYDDATDIMSFEHYSTVIRGKKKLMKMIDEKAIRKELSKR